MSKGNCRKRKKKEYCPECFDKNLITDTTHDEKYCETCGLVIQAPYPYVGGVHVEYPEPYDYSMLKKNIHYKVLDGVHKGRIGYKHNLPDEYIVNRYRKNGQNKGVHIYYKQ